ncbi:MAG: type II toxin-antitoxin system ParD family antitoxin [Caulobacterales bacterium]|nr:type II toxin-antitoxin system ParD family antitoxin [Caulobacterales bacterium]
MNVSLTPELEAFVELTVKSGRYASASEAVREGLRMLEEREAKFLRLKRDIEIGLSSGDAEEGSFSALAGRLRSEWDREQAALTAGAAARTAAE